MAVNGTRNLLRIVGLVVYPGALEPLALGNAMKWSFLLAAGSACSGAPAASGEIPNQNGSVDFAIALTEGGNLTLNTVAYDMRGSSHRYGFGTTYLTAPTGSRGISTRLGDIAPDTYDITLKGYIREDPEIECDGQVNGVSVFAGRAAAARLSIICYGSFGFTISVAGGTDLTLNKVAFDLKGGNHEYGFGTAYFTAAAGSKVISSRIGQIAPDTYDITITGRPAEAPSIECVGRLGKATVRAGETTSASVSIVCTLPVVSESSDNWPDAG